MSRKARILALAAFLAVILVTFQRTRPPSSVERTSYTHSLPSLSQLESSDQDFDSSWVPAPPQNKGPDHDSSDLDTQDLELPYLPTGNKESRIDQKSDFSTVFPRDYQFEYPLRDIMVRLPKAGEGRSLQYQFTEKSQDIKRMQAVKAVFAQGFGEYLKYASEYDEITPVTKEPKNTFTGWSITLIDSLDTLLIMNLTDQFQQALGVVEKMDFFTVKGRDDIPVFEMNIRALGGLISAFEISKEPLLLTKAVELGNLLLRAFDTHNHFPVSNLRNFKNGSLASTSSVLSEVGSLSLEFTKLSMLTNDETFFSAVNHFYTHLLKSEKLSVLPGLIPETIDLSGCEETMGEGAGIFKLNRFDNSEKVFTESGVSYCFSSKTYHGLRSSHREETYSLEGKSDSFYEYLVKMHALLNVPSNTNFTVTALESIAKYILFEAKTPDAGKLLLSGKVTATEGKASKLKFTSQASHLSCFAGSLYALSSKLFPFKEGHFSEVARNLTQGCLALSDKFNGLFPERVSLDRCYDDLCEYDEMERVRWIKAHTEHGTDSIQETSTRPKSIIIDGETYEVDEETEIPYSPLHYVNRIRWKTGNTDDQPLWVNSMDPRYLLRPELVESLFTLYRITGESYYREQGWKIFEAINRVATAKGNTFAPIDDVTKEVSEMRHLDFLESYWFAETLKYLYLLFSREDFFSLDEYVFNTEAHPFKRAT